MATLECRIRVLEPGLVNANRFIQVLQTTAKPRRTITEICVFAREIAEVSNLDVKYWLVSTFTHLKFDFAFDFATCLAELK